MLRASSLGLAFTRRIPRSTLPSPQSFHARVGHRQLSKKSGKVAGGGRHLRTPPTAGQAKTRTSTDARSQRPLPPHLELDKSSHPAHHRTSKPREHEVAPPEVLIAPDSILDDSPYSPEWLAHTRRAEASVADRKATPLRRGDDPLYEERSGLYAVLANSLDVDEAWGAYQKLLDLSTGPWSWPVPPRYLHCLAALIISKESQHKRQPATRTMFLRLLSVLRTLHSIGGRIRVWEWNALIDSAGKGWRRLREDSFEAALAIYNDMISQRAPGSSFYGTEFVPTPPPEDSNAVVDSSLDSVQPDIVTYTTLINIAGRTHNREILMRAESLLVNSGLPPNRITYLAYIRYFTRKGELSGVRSTLSRMYDEKVEIGIDGLNAVIWAFGRHNRLDISSSIYCLLRHNLLSKQGRGIPGISDVARSLYDLEEIVVPSTVVPDAVTYYSLVQAYAYHGRFYSCMEIFNDMVTASHDLGDAQPQVEADLSHPTLPVFRSIFLGFARHAQSSSSDGEAPNFRDGQDEALGWTLRNLHSLFSNFMKLPHDARPSVRTVYWVLVAFAVTSGNDRKTLQWVCHQLDKRFGKIGDGRVRTLRTQIFAAQFDKEFFDKIASRGVNSQSSDNPYL